MNNMQQNNNENAANRISYVGHNYDIGEKEYKKEVLNSLPEKWRLLHNEGYIHIHDLDAYGLTYNCLALDLVNSLPYSEFEGLDDTGKIMHLFHYIQNLFIKVGNEQSGGMAFANFDNEISDMLTKLNVKESKANFNIISSSIRELIIWCNGDHTRMGQTSYYITLNIGLAKNSFAKKIAEILLDQFNNLGDLVFKPNIVFKVCKGINLNPGDSNYDLYIKSLKITAKKMIPTYILCDSDTNKEINPADLAIMGCRSRVVNDIYGHTGAVGRGNIANITINLPRLALEIDKKHSDYDKDKKIEMFYEKWDDIASIVKDILLDRYHKLCSLKKEMFPTNLEVKLWCESFDTNNLEDVFKHGTLSIGFIGLSEAIEILTGEKYYNDMDNYIRALGLVKHMRDYCDFLRKNYNLNFSLLATAGELISGSFIEKDKKLYTPSVDIFKKGYYTNSFHIDVDSKLPGITKVKLEGLFHKLCNGGCITYVELGEAPLDNAEGLDEYIKIASKNSIHYLGFNFPKDVCKKCGTSGVFDECPKCHSKEITRIRRVSGYLEILDGFTAGKKAEEKNRKSN